MVLEHRTQAEMLETVRTAIREEMRSVQITSQQTKETGQQEAGNVSDDVLDFLMDLQNEGDDTI